MLNVVAPERGAQQSGLLVFEHDPRIDDEVGTAERIQRRCVPPLYGIAHGEAVRVTGPDIGALMPEWSLQVAGKVEACASEARSRMGTSAHGRRDVRQWQAGCRGTVLL